MHQVNHRARARRATLAAIGVWVLLAGGALPGFVPRADATGRSCGIRWGSLPKADPRMTTAPVIGLRAGSHACYDRFVVDINGRGAGWNVRYVPQVVSDGSGLPIALRGRAFLQVAVLAPSYDDAGHATYQPANRREAVNVAGFPTLRQVVFDGSFEGVSTIGIGVRARLPFRVFTLAGPGGRSRLVIDVAHRWG